MKFVWVWSEGHASRHALVTCSRAVVVKVVPNQLHLSIIWEFVWNANAWLLLTQELWLRSLEIRVLILMHAQFENPEREVGDLVSCAGSAIYFLCGLEINLITFHTVSTPLQKINGAIICESTSLTVVQYRHVPFIWADWYWHRISISRWFLKIGWFFFN